jgi:hypothetical protein
MLPGRPTIPERLFVWICSQNSVGHKSKYQRKKEMNSDGVRKRSEEKTEFWAVATPR